MAKRLNEDFEFPNEIRYPWDVWLDGSIWEITETDIGNTTLDTFRVNAHQAAGKRGIKIKTHIDRERSVVVIQADA